MAMEDNEYYNSTYFDHQDYDYDDSSRAGGSNIHRFLAPASGAPTVDYSVISIVVITLTVVLAVEVMRHYLDAAASGNPFFHTVLEMMYRELTTLGIVEFCIYLMHKYDDNFNYQMEVMFVDVHFMLFYTAVFNALQSCLVRIWTSHLTDRVWVQTEDMDIHHYVALRREYDRLEKKKSQTFDSDNTQNLESTSTWMSLQQALRDLAFKIRHPHQSRRMYQLMLPIRFHALRAHFIDSYQLPPRFKVSDYLKRSLTSVLLDFVHISSTAWIMLMATANLLWFVSGILLYKSKKSLEVEEFLVSIFIAMMVLFVLFAFVLFFKMISIFSNIMTMKLTTLNSEDERRKSWGDGARLSKSTTKTLDQLKLFWGGNPHLIIVATQYMQFGYALGFAMIFTYFKDFKKLYHIVSPEMLLVALLASYLIFLKLVSVIIPQYTICTSIGQLANKERLNETLAKLHLSQEIRKKETLEEVRKAEEEIARRKEKIAAKNAEVAARINRTSIPDENESHPDDSLFKITVSFSSQTKPDSEDDVLKQDVKEVSKMRQIGETDVASESSNMVRNPSERDKRKQRRRQMKARSEGVVDMRSSLPESTSDFLLKTTKEREPEKVATISSLAQISTRNLPKLDDHDVKLRLKTPSRRRASSAGVSMMSSGLIDNKNTNVVINPPIDSAVVATSEKGTEEFQGSTPMELTKSRVTFSPGKNNNLSPPETGADVRDDVSLDSTVSESGDFDVVPKVAHQLHTIKQEIDLAAFFRGSQYRTISLIFGPMLCFFFVAMRVEIFNIYAGTFVDQTNIWKYMLAPCFWVEVSLYCLMIVEMISVITVCLRKRGREGTLLSCSAATFGILINAMCLLLLLIAEMERCCPYHDNKFMRLLAGAAPSKGYDDPSEEYVECCPKFGERRYGGLGKIEPFTCLIALSPLRFIVAGYVVRLLGKASSHDEDTSATHEHHHGPDPTVKVREIWMAAIGVHSDIAKLFGPFSGELLQCMLGIYSSETSHSPASPSLLEATSQLTIGDPASSSANNETTEHDNQSHGGDNSSKAGITNPSTSPAIDRHEYFEYPEAPLIRRMRRGEMRLLPLLNDEWMLVDVVITRHELILFDIGDEADERQSPNALSTNDKTGGKFFSLRDVAQGRAIMDQFNLDDVDFVDIEHRAAIPDVVYDEDIENHNDLLEYWEGGDGLNGDYDANAMNKRWGGVDEDRLKIHFKDKQTLYLRFMVDLKEMEHKRKALADDPILMHHVGTHTKLWCSCIARIRGSVNLKQDLPHFGNKDTSEMLEDFIEICDRSDGSGHHRTKKMRNTFHKRNFGSFKNLDAPGRMAN